jgi:hypothetical protein
MMFGAAKLGLYLALWLAFLPSNINADEENSPS